MDLTLADVLPHGVELMVLVAAGMVVDVWNDWRQRERTHPRHAQRRKH